MENRKKHKETKLPHLLNPIKLGLKFLTLNTFYYGTIYKD